MTFKELYPDITNLTEELEEYEKLDIEYIKKKKNKGINIQNTNEYNEAKVTR